MRRTTVVLAALVFVCAACAAAPPRGAVDLTHPLRSGVPFFPGGVPYDVAEVALHETDGYHARRFSMGEHTGTHVDAPSHFHPDGWTIDAIPFGRLNAPLVVVDVRPLVRQAWDHAVTAEEIAEFERARGRIPAGSFVAILTGWSNFWADPERYRNPSRDGVMRFPGLDPSAARLLVDRGVVGVGIDALSIDPGPSADFLAHKVLAGGGVYVVENLANLDRLPARGAEIRVDPLPLEGGSGAPARVWGLVR